MDSNPGTSAVQAFKSVETCQRNVFGDVETNTAYIIYAKPQVGKTIECLGHLLKSWIETKLAPVLSTQNFSDEKVRFGLSCEGFNTFIANIWRFAGVSTPAPRIRLFDSNDKGYKRCLGKAKRDGGAEIPFHIMLQNKYRLKSFRDTIVPAIADVCGRDERGAVNMNISNDEGDLLVKTTG